MCLSWLLLVLLLGLPYAVRPRSCDWYKLLLLGCTLHPRSCSTLLALRHAHQVVSHGPSTVENGSSFLCCACMAGCLLVLLEIAVTQSAASLVKRCRMGPQQALGRRLSSTSVIFGHSAFKLAGLESQTPRAIYEPRRVAQPAKA